MIVSASGSLPTLMGRPGLPVATDTGVTVWPPAAMYSVRLSGVTASASGYWPTRIGGPGLSVATLTGVTDPSLAPTYSIFPSGVITIRSGSLPTRIGLPALPVATDTGVTVCPLRLQNPLLPQSATYKVRPSGVSARASGPRPE